MSEESKTPTILITRDGDACARFADALQVYAAVHINCVSLPLLKTYNFDIQLPSSTVCDKIIVTSERALPWLEANLYKLSEKDILCVGPHLEQQITACGYFHTQTYPQVKSLLEDKAAYADKHILYVRGVDIRHDLAAKMKNVAQGYSEITVYEARQEEDFPPHIHALFREERLSYLTVFSARAAEALVRVIRTHGLEEVCTRIQCLCLSDRVVKSLGSVAWKDVHIAGTPDMNGMAKRFADILKM